MPAALPPPEVATAARQAARDFPLLVPHPWLARIVPGDPHDPLLLQVLPRAEELAEVPHFQRDPLGEAAAGGTSGLLWKYPGRLLIVAAGACAVHCRYCFRRHFPFASLEKGDSPHLPERPQGCCAQMGTVPFFLADDDGPWEAALQLAAAEPSIEEIILSGGDPLSLPDARLSHLTKRLAAIPHLRRLRIHSRLPIMIPQRVTGELLDWLRGSRLTPILVVQVNHPAEIDAAVAAALGRLVDAGVPVLAQAVLLRGVNDDLETLARLFGRLVDLRVMPYYLHQLDRVAGAAHFEVAPQRGRELIEQLRGRLPGYAVPRYVCETPGRSSKVVLA